MSISRRENTKDCMTWSSNLAQTGGLLPNPMVLWSAFTCSHMIYSTHPCKPNSKPNSKLKSKPTDPYSTVWGLFMHLWWFDGWLLAILPLFWFCWVTLFINQYVTTLTKNPRYSLGAEKDAIFLLNLLDFTAVSLTTTIPIARCPKCKPFHTMFREYHYPSM